MLAVGLELPAQSPRPFTIGVMSTLRSEALGEDRILNIVLPQGYSTDSAARFPVIYVLDGSVDEDIVHIAGLVQFASMPWIDWLPPSIVVGIANVDRRRDFTHPTSISKDKADFPSTGGSAAFMRFLGDELIPFIDSAYRTAPDRMLIGQSLGGLLATEVLVDRPGLFKQLVIVSPSLWWDNGSVLERIEEAGHKEQAVPHAVFIAVGKEGRIMERGAKRLAALLRRGKRIRVGYAHLTKHDHATILHQAVLDALRWMKQGR